MLLSSPSPTSWRGSPGRVLRRGEAFAVRGLSAAYGCVRELVGALDGQDDQEKSLREGGDEMASQSNGAPETWFKNGARRRESYEDRGARISILAGREAFEAGYVEAN